MSEAETLFVALRQSADAAVVDMLARMVRDAPDHALNRINAPDLAAKKGVGEEQLIAALDAYRQIGVAHLALQFMVPRWPDRVEQIERFAREVRPHLRP